MRQITPADIHAFMPTPKFTDADIARVVKYANALGTEGAQASPWMRWFRDLLASDVEIESVNHECDTLCLGHDGPAILAFEGDTGGIAPRPIPMYEVQVPRTVPSISRWEPDDIDYHVITHTRTLHEAVAALFTYEADKFCRDISMAMTYEETKE